MFKIISHWANVIILLISIIVRLICFCFCSIFSSFTCLSLCVCVQVVKHIMVLKLKIIFKICLKCYFPILHNSFHPSSLISLPHSHSPMFLTISSVSWLLLLSYFMQKHVDINFLLPIFLTQMLTYYILLDFHFFTYYIF